MVPKLQLVMLLSLRVIASITTDLYVVVSTIATCVLLVRLLRTCMLLFWLLPLAYPVSFIAHLLLSFRPLFTTVSNNSSIHLLLTIFNYAVIWLGEEGFCLMTRFIYAWYHLCCVHWSARYRKSNLAFPRAFLVIFALIGFRFLSKVFIKRIYSA